VRRKDGGEWRREEGEGKKGENDQMKTTETAQ